MTQQEFMSKETEKRQPSEAARRAVRGAFNGPELKDICERDTESFAEFGQKWILRDPNPKGDGIYFYQDNGSQILGIAHLDSVQSNRRCRISYNAAGPLVVSGALDDRLGAYVILKLLPKLGITCDWLLTTDEEIGSSTAEAFRTDKRYHWMFQFDRGGTDVVMYDYDTPELRKLVEESGARCGRGSFSDICCLKHLGCSGMNWGVGYEDYHSLRSHAWLADTFRMVARFEKFYFLNSATPIPYEPKTWHGGSGYHKKNPDTEYRKGDWWDKTQWRWRRKDDRDAPKSDIEKWWERSSLQEADCGHLIDLDDEDTYFDLIHYILCAACCTGWNRGKRETPGEIAARNRAEQRQAG